MPHLEPTFPSDTFGAQPAFQSLEVRLCCSQPGLHGECFRILIAYLHSQVFGICFDSQAGWRLLGSGDLYVRTVGILLDNLSSDFSAICATNMQDDECLFKGNSEAKLLEGIQQVSKILNGIKQLLS